MAYAVDIPCERLLISSENFAAIEKYVCQQIVKQYGTETVEGIAETIAFLDKLDLSKDANIKEAVKDRDDFWKSRFVKLENAIVKYIEESRLLGFADEDEVTDRRIILEYRLKEFKEVDDESNSK